MAIHGSLSTMPLSDLLVWVQTSRRNGTITVQRDGHEWELTAKAGHVVAYMGPELRDNLGHIVVTSGMLTEDDLRLAYQQVRDKGGSLQDAFVDNALLTRKDLEDCLTELATEAIYDLFLDLPGEFVFTETQDEGLELGFEVEQRLPLSLSVNGLLMEGACRQDEWEHIRRRFPNDNVKISIVHDKLPPIETLSVRARRVLASLSAGQNISDICLELRAPIPSVLRTIAKLQDEGALDVEAVDEESAPSENQRVQLLLDKAAIMRDAQQFDEALVLLDAAVRMSPTDDSIRGQLRELITDQIQDLYRQLPPVQVPVVVASTDRLRSFRMTSEERFLLERLAARMDVGSLVMMSSVNERETLKTLAKFVHAGIVELE